MHQPTGWDNLKKISILEENLTKFKRDDPFSSIVPQPEEERSAPKETEVTAIDEQVSTDVCVIHLAAMFNKLAVAITARLFVVQNGMKRKCTLCLSPL
ncbi:unnamed protein product [Dibothriocephalus latus]|uniref:Dynein light intermediate chain n=1 Tax=Dibothriocephalus latus TaxID=60516 RepID=A0A3P7P578_DIBLA|nr:unnamed protein product [Dibothriocephalus latus]